MKKQSAVVVGLSGLVIEAQAAVPSNVTTALTDMATDTLTVAGAFLAAAITLAAYMFMRRGAK